MRRALLRSIGSVRLVLLTLLEYSSIQLTRQGCDRNPQGRDPQEPSSDTYIPSFEALLNRAAYRQKLALFLDPRMQQ